MIIIIFYGFAFGLVGGGITFTQRSIHATNQQVVTNKSHQGDYANGSIINYQNFFEFIVEEYDKPANGNYDVPSNIDNETDFAKALNDFISSDYKNINSTNDFWETTGIHYFNNLDVFSSVITFKTLFDQFNADPTTLGFNSDIDFQVVYNIYPNDLYKPKASTSDQELYYFMGFNSPGESSFNGDQDSPYSLRYAGENDDYVIDDYQIIDSENNMSKDEIDSVLGSSDEDVYGNGTRQDPYKIVIQNEYAQANDLKPGDVIQIDRINYEIMATANFANIIYPVYSGTSFVTNFDEQSAILMNSNTLYEVGDKNLTYTIDYGFTDIYDNVDDYSDYYVPTNSPEDSILLTRQKAINRKIGTQTNHSFDPGSAGLITGEKFSLESSRINLVFSQINNSITLINIFSKVFLIVVIVILILLIQRRVKDYGKQFGTLKALGLSKTESAASFLVYPFFIVMAGGLTAFIISIPVQFFFIWALTNFYSLPIGGYMVNFALFYTLFIFSAIILFALSFLVSNFILRKPAVDLLSNKVNDNANWLTREAGKVIPNSASFSASYKVKGFTRATGKSLLLITSVFLATSLTALSLASSTMINKVNDATASTFKFDYYNTIDQGGNDYDIYDVNDVNYKDLDSLYSDVDTSTVHSDKTDFSSELLTASELKSYTLYLARPGTSVEDAYDDLGTIVISEFDTTVVSTTGNVNYYLPKEAVINYILILNILKVNSGFNWDTIYNTEWGDSGYSAASLDPFVKTFEINAYTKYYYDTNKDSSDFDQKEIKRLENGNYSNLNDDYQLFYDIYNEYTSDIVFKDLYYDSNYQTLASLTSGLSFRTKNEDGNNQTVIYPLTIFQTSDDISNVYNIDPEATQALKDEETKVDNGEQLDYLPVVLDSFTYNYIMNNYDVPTDENGNWELKINSKTIDVKVIYVYDSYITVGYLTTEKLYSNMFPNEEVKYNNVFWNGTGNSKSTYTLSMSNEISGSVNFDYFVNDPNNLEGTTISKNLIASQTTVLYNVLKIYLLIISFFALMTGLTLILIAMKEINDKSKREVALLKSFGYSSKKATSLVLTPFIIILMLGFILAVPFSIMILALIASILTNATGSTFVLSLTVWQWIFILGLLILLVIFLIIYSFISFKRTNALEVIKETEG